VSQSRKKKNSVFPLGFTLIEVLAAIAIIGIILSISIPKFTSEVNKVNDKGEEVNLQLLEGAVKQYKLDTRIYPASLEYLLVNPGTGIPGWAGPYLKSIPESPKGQSYDIDTSTGQVIIR
jgi:general secretion pathway protein G